MWVNKQCWKCFNHCVFTPVLSDKLSSYILGAALSTALPCGWGMCVQRWCTGRPSRVSTQQAWGGAGEDPYLGVFVLNILLTLSLNERSLTRAGKVGDVAQVLWVSRRSGWKEEYCLEFGQVLLEHVTNFESTGEGYLGLPVSSFSLGGSSCQD